MSAHAKRLVQATRKGPIVEWVERISAIAESLGVALWNINWNQTPKLVAHDVARLVYTMEGAARLEEAIAQLEKDGQQ